MGFAVYKADIVYHDDAEFGDELDIRTTYEKESDYRLIWTQEAWRPGGEKPAVKAIIHLVCLDRDKQLKTIPPISD